MGKRFVSIWFPFLVTDWFCIQQPSLKQIPFVVSASSHGRMVVAGLNLIAKQNGINKGMALADARAIVHGLKDEQEVPSLQPRLLRKLAEWCIRFTPVASIDLPDGLLLDVTGCPHLWGGDDKYIDTIHERFIERGYSVQIAIADTAGAAWGMARYGPCKYIFPVNEFPHAFMQLPAAAIHIDAQQIIQLTQLGLRQVNDFVSMPRSVLLRRFGKVFLDRIDEMTGKRQVILEPVVKPAQFEERFYCLDYIRTRAAIDIALEKLVTSLCKRLQQNSTGIRQLNFCGYKIDSTTTIASIGTHRLSYNPSHLLKLFQSKIDTLSPEPGIELFVLTAVKVEPLFSVQEKLWQSSVNMKSEMIGELLDRVENKIGKGRVFRFLPSAHYWPERSFKIADNFDITNDIEWKANPQRPILLLPLPEAIAVTAPVPDYPPMLFRYKQKIHKIVTADGPERIEQEWWLEDGEHRDYYCVEDEDGKRYWIFRSGHYRGDKRNQWFIHGFFS